MTSEPILQYVNPNDLTEHPEAHRIPEMTADEWTEFSENVRIKKMITSPVFALRNGVVFDGRHRLRAAMEYGIKLIPVLFYDITEDEALERMADAAIIRRQLLPGQRAAIVLEFGELVASVKAAARERQRQAGEEYGRGKEEKVLPDLAKANPTQTHVELAEKASIGKSSMQYLMAVQRDEPELFEKVKAGEITINKAYTEVKKRKQLEETPVITDKPSDEKIKRMKHRKKPEPIRIEENESPISANNRLNILLNEHITPCIDELLGSYRTIISADEEARKPIVQELKVMLEASFRILAEIEGEEIIKTMEGISDDE